jgi:flagellin-like hook-associated protein FlgL
MSTILSTGVRQNLNSLQSIKTQQTATENRLATGKKVNSALDNPVNYFTSAALNDRSGDLTNLLDGVQNSVQTLQAASNGIESITALVKNAQSAAKQALQTADSESDATLSGSVSDLKRSTSLISTTSGPGFTDGDTITLTSGTGSDTKSVSFTIGSGAGEYSTVGDLLKAVNNSSLDVTATLNSDGEIGFEETGGENLAISSTGTTALTSMGFGSSNLTATASTSTTRDSFRQQFNDILDQIDQMAKDSGYNGINLLMGNDLTTIFNEKTGTDQSKMNISGTVFNSSGLGLEKLSTGDFQNNKQVNRVLDSLTSALTSLRTQSSTFGSNLSMVQARKDFTNNMVSTLNTGADQLVAADTNAESANLLALQTRQSLSTKALSLANQADQSILQLF